ncbi:hypothetical protein ACI3LY_004310 [Candidozyma auris]|uniref:Large ribosomal subunit protein mL46 n=2 Tax=Candidozyma auris TaxID=498019 RepID=A0A8F2W362_CANAR|nr:mitochondrial 54S ribosomal protein YmL17/YmL30 [[Candida] auris]KNE01851.2 hypothetical protein QG37_01194 [[Candida] auris]PIS48969.1 hypothetical protein CJI97_005130 [[Candida] auris]QEO22950.1 hypothetical_protein [[Candida] auris]QWW24859.1 hypothetical protein CA7LBN_003716 [[Candida] auris]GBL48998.1 hypothetical protein CAJCM15448_12720 [[Candida] auris]
MLGTSVKTMIRCYSTEAAPAIRSTLLLSRNPVITADMPAFQKQYYRYQKELWKRLMWTFPKWFFFRPGTVAELKFREINKKPIHDNPNIEFIGGRPDVQHDRDRRFKQEIKLPQTYDDKSKPIDELSKRIVPNSRTTEADKKNDMMSLERKLSRTLYLLVSEDGKSWNFPSFANEDLPLHKTAEAGVISLAGDQFNYFNVSKTPCHVHNSGNDKSFFIKSHILSGKFEVKNPATKHLWLTKEEVGEHLEEKYFQEIEHLLSDI